MGIFMDDIDIKRYIQSLSFKSEQEYASWCIQLGFSRNFPKTSNQLNKEKIIRQKYIFNYSMKKHRKIKTLNSLINFFRENEDHKTESSLKQEQHELFEKYFIIAKQWSVENVYLDVLEHLNKISKLTEGPFFKKILTLTLYHEFWLKDFKKWKPTSHNTQKQFSNLLRYLLTKYDVPSFMDSAWDNVNQDLHKDWFIFLGNGGNIRKAKNLSIPLTKKQAHYFTQTPAHYTINHAFIYAKVRSEGGSERLANALKTTQLMSNLNNEKNSFCLSVIRFFIDNSMLDLAHVGPITDYIWNQKYTYSVDGILQPNFSMNGRTPEAFLNSVNRWHKKLGKQKKRQYNTWERCKINEFEMITGSSQKNNLKIWKIIELCSTKELHNEGEKQKNCVVSYSNSCVNKQCAIFSLRFGNTYTNFETRTTIEIRNKTIYQMRNKYNKLPQLQDIDVIDKWISKENLKKIL